MASPYPHSPPNCLHAYILSVYPLHKPIHAQQPYSLAYTCVLLIYTALPTKYPAHALTSPSCAPWICIYVHAYCSQVFIFVCASLILFMLITSLIYIYVCLLLAYYDCSWVAYVYACHPMRPYTMFVFMHVLILWTCFPHRIYTLLPWFLPHCRFTSWICCLCEYMLLTMTLALCMFCSPYI